jgi:hypothetical protein
MEGVSVVVVVAGAWLASDAVSFVTGAVVESVGVVVEVVVSVAADSVVDVEEVSEGVADPDVEAPSTTGVDVEFTKGALFSI